MKENLLIVKSIAFASRIIKLNQYLVKTKKETIISKQNPLSKEGGFLFVLFIFHYSSFIIHLS